LNNIKQMKPVVVIAGILLLLLIVAVCCTPKSDSDSDSDSNSSSDDSSNKSVAKGLGKTLDTGRMGYKYEDKMCVAVKEAPNGVDVFLTKNECDYKHKKLGPDGKHIKPSPYGQYGYKYEGKMCVGVREAPNEHANPPIYDSLMDCYRHHTPLDPLGFKWIDGKCKAVAVEPNGVDVFLTENECNYRHKKLGPDGKQYGYKYEDKMCVVVHEAPNGVDVFLTENECNYRHKTLGPDGKHHEHPHVHPYGPDGKHHVHPYGPDGKHHVHPYGPGGLEDGYKLVYDGKEEECIKVNKPIDNVNVLTKEVCEYKLENGYGPHGKGYRPDLKPKPQPHPGHDECTYEKNQYILINSN
jgi:hypothetical protein